MNKQAFCIMQIGNPEMDRVFNEVFEPAAVACGLTAKRVDKHNFGKLLKSEIVEYLKVSEILIADITNERPNCYLEIGYAMGLGKISNLILCARQDHLPGHPSHLVGGPKIHFDLGGYDIILWDPADMDAFQRQLIAKTKQRLNYVRNNAQAEQIRPDLWADKWIEANQKAATAGLHNAGLGASMEFAFRFDEPVEIPSSQLVRAMDQATQQWFGWPIGVVLHTEEGKPKANRNGIISEISSSFDSYDYWTLTKNLHFYTLLSLFEDVRSKTPAFWIDVRIGRIAEALLL